MHFLDNHTNIKALLIYLADAIAMFFGVSNGIDYLSLKVNGYTLIFSTLIDPMNLHYFFQELFFYFGGFLSLAWLTFRLLTQYQSYKKAKKDIE